MSEQMVCYPAMCGAWLTTHKEVVKDMRQRIYRVDEKFELMPLQENTWAIPTIRRMSI
jgi:hypothetical protein